MGHPSVDLAPIFWFINRFFAVIADLAGQLEMFALVVVRDEECLGSAEVFVVQ